MRQIWQALPFSRELSLFYSCYWGLWKMCPGIFVNVRCFLFTLVSVGHNEIIGVCRVGINAEGLGRDHWNEMLAYPRKPIAHWHPLVEVNEH